MAELLPSGLYRVRLDEGAQVVAHIADRIERNFVRVLVGDRVRVELSRRTSRGRIVGKSCGCWSAIACRIELSSDVTRGRIVEKLA